MINANNLVRPVNRIPVASWSRATSPEPLPSSSRTRPDLVVAMLILDTDLYESTKVALQTFLPLMPKGGVVVFDEVAYVNFPGKLRRSRRSSISIRLN